MHNVCYMCAAQKSQYHNHTGNYTHKDFNGICAGLWQLYHFRPTVGLYWCYKFQCCLIVLKFWYKVQDEICETSIIYARNVVCTSTHSLNYCTSKNFLMMTDHNALYLAPKIAPAFKFQLVYQPLLFS